MNPHANRFFQALAILLLGYGLMGKGFAYLGVPPLYVGEMVMGLGIIAVLFCPNWSRMLGSALIWPIVAFMAWGAVCTIPYIKTYGTFALRDAAVWIWGLFAIAIATLLAAEPWRLARLERQFRFFAKVFLIVAPISFCINDFVNPYLPDAPWTGVPFIAVKGGDLVVHLTGIFAYAVLLGGILPAWPLVLLTILNLIFNFTGRAAMVTFGLGAAAAAVLHPKSPIVLKIFPMLIIGVTLLWVADVHIYTPGGNQRSISADQFIQNIASIFTDSENDNLAGSKQWRLKWWDTIYQYTINGRYFWTGKGFGINLADDDGFQVRPDEGLRSPHNGHLTMLARAGVPGLVLWLVCQLSWTTMILIHAIAAYRRGLQHWASLLAFLLIFWAAFMTNAAFDVYLEGPVGGIWMWSVFGVGLGAIWIFRNCPEALDETNPARAAGFSRQHSPTSQPSKSVKPANPSEPVCAF